MKVTLAVIFSLGYLAAISALPAGRDEEVEFIPLADRFGGAPGVVDTGVLVPSWGPFDGLFESLAGMVARMRQQMDYLLRRLPVGNRTIEEGPFPGFPDIDLSKANTTSVTKVIDGHKVVINETEYKHSGENGGAFFKVRIIDVLPDSSELTTEKEAESITTPSRETESVESSLENEIPKNREIEELSSLGTSRQAARTEHLLQVTNRNLEDFESVESMEGNSLTPFEKLTDGTSKWASLEPFESFEDNSIEAAYRPIDLSRDTYVNQIMADAGAPTNPDAEVFSSAEFSVPYATDRKPYIEKITNPR